MTTSIFRFELMKCSKVPLSVLKTGAVLSAPILDPIDSRVKLLAEGTKITDMFIHQLRARRVENVILSQRDIAILAAFIPQGRRIKVPPPPPYVRSLERNDYSDAVDDYVENGGPLEELSTTIPISADIKKPIDCGYAEGLPTQWALESNQRIDRLTEFFADTLDGETLDVKAKGLGPLRQICLELIDCMIEDQDALVCMACSPYESDYPSRHGIHLASMAIVIGAEMGLSREDLIELGIGCLIHDVGMQAVGLGMFDTGQPLSQGQLKRLSSHPVKAIEIAGEYDTSLSDLARFVIYQIHERSDGSGYPRGITADVIHPLAKIAAVADAFVGMLTKRKHRLAIQGYYAISHLLQQMKVHKFDAKVIRALLQATSLYPLGSHVMLSNKRVGRVIRSGGADFVLPTIEMWDPGHEDQKPIIVNLKEEFGIQITASRAA